VTKKPTYAELEHSVEELEKEVVRRTEAEDELKIFIRQIEFILGATKTGLDIVDSEFNLLYVNQEWQQVYGDPTGKKCYEYFMGLHEVCLGCGAVEALNTKMTSVTEKVLVREDDRAVQVTTIPFQNDQGEWLAAEVNADITELKWIEDELQKTHYELGRRVRERTVELAKRNEQLKSEIAERKKAEQELRKANRKILEQQKTVVEEERLKVLLQTAGATAEELNQPLAALLDNIDSMKIDKDDPQKLLQHTHAIAETGHRISDIVNKFHYVRRFEVNPHSTESTITNLDQEINILSVEDSDVGFATIKALLKKHNQINLSRGKNIEEAFQVLTNGQFDLILLDYMLPDGNGLDFLRILDQKGFEIPVVVITGEGDEMTASQVIQAGACDYLPKDMLDKKALLRIISNALEMLRFKKESKIVQMRLTEMATVDQLTGLYNRRYFMEALEREVARAGKHEFGLVLCMVDLDHFKQVNDTYGHPAGDMVLSEIGRNLKQCIRESDLICRCGGEEFAVILPNTQPEKARIVCERFREMVAGHKFGYNSSEFYITVSIGIASYDGGKDQSPVKFVEVVDQALYQAKNAGRNKVVQYSETP
jgi:two-component system cell cycle response regulator